MSKKKGEILREHVVFRSPLSGRFYYAPRAYENPETGVGVVRGKKYDVTEHLQPYLLKRYRLEKERSK